MRDLVSFDRDIIKSVINNSLTTIKGIVMTGIYLYMMFIILIFAFLIYKFLGVLAQKKRDKEAAEEREDNVFYDAAKNIRRDR
jgi:hypothetical protein